MKKSLLAFAISVTSSAIATTIYLATLESPTDIQKQLFTTSSAIAVAGTTSIFSLLDDDEQDDKPSGS
ncbi:MAG: hypothetical protein AAGD25_18895 [Cyanobacteria bacterium P01_F01_bin.150]